MNKLYRCVAITAALLSGCCNQVPEERTIQPTQEVQIREPNSIPQFYENEFTPSPPFEYWRKPTYPEPAERIKERPEPQNKPARPQKLRYLEHLPPAKLA